MRYKRVKSDNGGYYHLVSRIVDKDFKFDSKEKDIFVAILRKVAGFSGVDVLTYAIMSNHFHLLVHVPQAEDVSDDVLLERLNMLYGKGHTEELRGRWRDLTANGAPELATEEQARFKVRMYDVSQFMKTLKQRVSVCFNSRHERAGTMWEGRFKSVLIEGCEKVLTTVAAYIDLNPVRAGIVKRPEDFRWSGYGAAAQGKLRERAALRKVLLSHPSFRTWREVDKLYGKLLRAKVITESDDVDKLRNVSVRGATSNRKMLRRGDELPVSLLLHCRVRHFSSGLAVGGRRFVEDVFERNRGSFGANRKSGARRIKACQDFELYSARDIKKDAIVVST